jgi:hypothetical protein
MLLYTFLSDDFDSTGDLGLNVLSEKDLPEGAFA